LNFDKSEDLLIEDMLDLVQEEIFEEIQHKMKTIHLIID